MRHLETVITVGLMFLSLVIYLGDGMCPICAIEKSILIFELKDTSESKPDKVKPDTSILDYPLNRFRSLLDIVLPVFVVQIGDAATSDEQLKFLHQLFPLSVKEPDTALLEKVLCTAANGKSILSLSELKALNIEDSTRIWFVQAVNDFTRRPWVWKLCWLIEDSDDSANGLQGILDKKDVSTAAAVANTVISPGQAARVFLTGLKNSPAPVPKAALPFVPTKTVWNSKLQSGRNRGAYRSLTS